MNIKLETSYHLLTDTLYNHTFCLAQRGNSYHSLPLYKLDSEVYDFEDALLRRKTSLNVNDYSNMGYLFLETFLEKPTSNEIRMKYPELFV
jgi:hypothetical protein